MDLNHKERKEHSGRAAAELREAYGVRPLRGAIVHRALRKGEKDTHRKRRGADSIRFAKPNRKSASVASIFG